MSRDTKALLEAFEHLPAAAEKRVFTDEVLRCCGPVTPLKPLRSSFSGRASGTLTPANVDYSAVPPAKKSVK
jgi:hypothetical protein